MDDPHGRVSIKKIEGSAPLSGFQQLFVETTPGPVSVIEAFWPPRSVFVYSRSGLDIRRQHVDIDGHVLRDHTWPATGEDLRRTGLLRNNLV